MRAGLNKGIPGYDQCVGRELSYLEENRRIIQSLRDKNR